MRNDVYIVVLVYYHDCWGVRGLFTSSHIKIPVQGGGEYSALTLQGSTLLGALSDDSVWNTHLYRRLN